MGGSELSPLPAPDRWWVPLPLLACVVALSGLTAQFWVMFRLLDLAYHRGLSATFWPALGLLLAGLSALAALGFWVKRQNLLAAARPLWPVYRDRIGLAVLGALLVVGLRYAPAAAMAWANFAAAPPLVKFLFVVVQLTWLLGTLSLPVLAIVLSEVMRVQRLRRRKHLLATLGPQDWVCPRCLKSESAHRIT